MKNLISVSPLRIIHKSASGLAVLCYTQDEWKRYQIGLGIRVTHPTRFINGVWLPLSQVVVKDGAVVAVSGWVVKAKGLAKEAVGVW